VRAGEVVTSAWAMDEPTMKKLYKYNMSFDKDEEQHINLSQAQAGAPRMLGRFWTFA